MPIAALCGFLWAVNPPSISPGSEPTVDPQLMSRDVRGGAGREKHQGTLQILRLRHAAHRHAGAVFRLELIVLPAQHAAGGQRVHAHTLPAPERGEVLR